MGLQFTIEKTPSGQRNLLIRDETGEQFRMVLQAVLDPLSDETLDDTLTV